MKKARQSPGYTVLRAIPRSWFSWDYTVTQGLKPVARIDVSRWREKGQLTILQERYTMCRERLLAGAFVLASDSEVLSRAVKHSALRRSYGIDYKERHYVLKAWSALRRDFILLDGSTVIGSIRPEGFFSRRAAVVLPEDMPLPLKVFIIWLVLNLWRRADHAAGANAC